MQAIRRLICVVRGHRFVEHRVSVEGSLVAVSRCARCRHVDVESIEISGWNRSLRRQNARAVAKKLVDGHGR